VRTVIVAGLGPADVDLIPPRTTSVARDHPTFLRTRRHPAAVAFGDASSFDEVYRDADTIDEVYETIVERLVASAADRTTVYLVPGSPLVAERTVELLRSDERVDLVVEPAMSFVDVAWARLGVDPFADGVALVDGHRFDTEIDGVRGPVLVGQCDDRFVLSDIKLAIDAENPPTVTVLQRLGLPDEAVFEVEWTELDRAFVPDHLTSLWIPRLPDGPSAALGRLHQVVGRLRAECPWDRGQSHHSLVPFVLEEADEVAEAIAALDPLDPTAPAIDDFVSELGDLLFQVMLHSAIGEESGDFGFVAVADAITSKMIRRHPHVFERSPGEPLPTMEELSAQWREIKQQERAERGE